MKTLTGLSQYVLWILGVGVAIILFLPLLVTPDLLYLFHFYKAVVFRDIVEIMLALYVGLAIAEPRFRPKSSPLLWAILAFVAIYLLDAFLGTNTLRSIWGSVDRMGGFFTYIHYVAFFIIISSIVYRYRAWMLMLSASLITSTLMSLYAYGQFFHLGSFFLYQQQRVLGTIENPIFFAEFVLMNMFIGAYLFLKAKSSWWRVLVAVMVGVSFIAFLMAQTRGAVVGLLLGLFVWGIVYGWYSGRRAIVKKTLIGTVVLFLIWLALFVAVQKKAFGNFHALDRFVNITPAAATAQTRFWAWETAWHAWTHRFVFGWGPENFNVAFNQYYDPRFYTAGSTETWFDRAHNIVFDVGTEYGIVGLAAYLSIFGVLFYRAGKLLKQKKKVLLASFIIGIMVAYFGQNLSSFDNFSSFYMFYLLLGFSAVALFGSDDSWGDEPYDLSLSRGSAEAALPVSTATTSLPHKNHQRKNHHIKGVVPEVSAEAAATASQGFAPAPYTGRRPSLLIIVILLIGIGFSIYYFGVLPIRQQEYVSQGVLAASQNTTGGLTTALADFQKASAVPTYLGQAELWRNRLLPFETAATSSNDKQLVQNALQFSIAEELKAIHYSPTDAEYYWLLGHFYNDAFQATGDTADVTAATHYLDVGLQLAPKHYYLILEKARTMMLSGNYSAGIALFKEIVANNANFSSAYWSIGAAYYIQKNDQQAVNWFAQAVAKGYDPYSNQTDLAMVSQAYLDLNDYAGLKTLYTTGITRYPNNAGLHAKLAVVYAKLNDVADARAQAEDAIKLDPTLATAAKVFLESLH